MNPRSSPPRDEHAEIAALIETLHETGKRLETLTAGEVDTVADHEGRPFLLQHAQNTLRHSEAAKQAALLNALPAQIALLDARGLIIEVNEAWKRFARENSRSVVGLGVGGNYLEVCDAAQGSDRAEARSAAAGIRSVLDGRERRFTIEYPCHSPAASRWFLMTVTPLAEGRHNGAVVMHVDVTAERQAKESLRLSESRFREMAQNIEDVFFLQDLDGEQVFYVSPGYEKIWGRSCESLYANPASWRDSIHPGDRARVFTASGEGRDRGIDHEYRIVRPDGETRSVNVRGYPILDEAGRPYRTAGVATDITRRKHAEQELLESERRYSDMLGNVQLVSLMLDREARITYCNEYFLRLTGWRREEVIGANWFDVFMPPELGDMRPVFMALLDNVPEASHRENEIVTRSGERRLIRWNNTLLRSVDGGVIGAASIGEDITEQAKSQEALRQNEGRTRSIVDSALDAVVVMDAGGRITDWNAQAERTFGWTREQVLGKLLADTIVPARHREAHARGLRGFLETGAGPIFNRRIEISAMHREGREFPVELAVSPVRVAGAWIFSAFIRDLSDRRDAENRIKRLNRVHAVLSGISTLIVRARDRGELFKEACRMAVEDGQFLAAWVGIVDRGAMKIVPVASTGVDMVFFAEIEDRLSLLEDAPTGHGTAAVAVREARAVVVNHVETDPQVHYKGAHADQGIRATVSLPLLVADEAVGVFCLHASEAGFFDEAELKLLAGLARDVAYAMDHIDKQDRLDYLAYYDVLTGLANRSLFLERVAQYMRSAVSGKHRLALFLIDIERFKNINDSLGQPAGDALLRQVAEWLTRNAGDANLVARIGADHFAVVLPEIKREGNVARLLEKSIKGFLEQPFRLDEAVFRIAAKVGVALYPEDGGNADILLKRAEAALKEAKASGERYVFYAQRMSDTSAGTLSLENQLRQAIDKGEFVLHYQPKVNLVTGKLTGAEALIRWNDPQTGLVPPGRFIPVLEETGLIHEVGRWAVQTAVDDYLRWRAAGLSAVRIAVNVSPLQLRSRAFIEEIRSAIGIDAHAADGLELEITENLIMEDMKHSIASLQAIRAMGVSIAIDDFGTGFSSLSYLARLPVDTLKIDRSFVVDMTSGPQGLALVSTVITLAHALKLKVVAEGVETEEQSRLLRVLGCDEMQGYLFSKPVPGETFEARFLASP